MVDAYSAWSKGQRPHSAILHSSNESSDLLQWLFHDKIVSIRCCRRHRLDISSSAMASQNGMSLEGQIQCHCEVDLSSEHEDDQVDASNPDQVNGRIPGRLDNVGRCVLEPLG